MGSGKESILVSNVSYIPDTCVLINLQRYGRTSYKWKSNLPYLCAPTAIIRKGTLKNSYREQLRSLCASIARARACIYF